MKKKLNKIEKLIKEITEDKYNLTIKIVSESEYCNSEYCNTYCDCEWKGIHLELEKPDGETKSVRYSDFNSILEALEKFKKQVNGEAEKEWEEYRKIHGDRYIGYRLGEPNSNISFT